MTRLKEIEREEIKPTISKFTQQILACQIIQEKLVFQLDNGRELAISSLTKW